LRILSRFLRIPDGFFGILNRILEILSRFFEIHWEASTSLLSLEDSFRILSRFLQDSFKIPSRFLQDSFKILSRFLWILSVLLIKNPGTRRERICYYLFN